MLEKKHGNREGGETEKEKQWNERKKVKFGPLGMGVSVSRPRI